VYDTALNHVRASRLTDAEFIYTPSQIALAAFSLAAPDVAQQWLESKQAVTEAPTKIPLGILGSIEALKNLIVDAGQPETEAVREVDRRLRLCKNPEKVVGSKAYLARKAEEEKKAEDKRNRKAMEVEKAAAEGADPFGDELERPKPSLVDYDDDDDD